MKKYVVIGLMKLYWSNQSENIIQNIICIIIWSDMCRVSIREEIIINPPYQTSRPLLVILIVSKIVDFWDTRLVLLIGPLCMWYDNINIYIMTIELNKILDNHDQMVGKSWAICSIDATNFYVVIIMFSGEGVNKIFCITLVNLVKNLQRDSCDVL